MVCFKKITHILFDMDGLLLDTEPLYTQVTQKIVRRYGKEFNWNIKSKMIGKKSIDAAYLLVDLLNLPLSPHEYLEECETLLEDLFPLTKPLPGAFEMTNHFYNHNIPQAVATSSDKRMFQLKTVNHKKWFSIFDCIVTADTPGVNNGKPAPDIFLSAAKQMGARPEKCLVFEDAPSGMQAALNANMQVVVVPDSNMDKNLYKDAHIIIESLNDFQIEHLGIPPL